MRVVLAAVAVAALACGLSGCVAYDVAATAVDVGATAVSTTADVAGDVVSGAASTVSGSKDDEKKDR